MRSTEGSNYITIGRNGIRTRVGTDSGRPSTTLRSRSFYSKEGVREGAGTAGSRARGIESWLRWPFKT